MRRDPGVLRRGFDVRRDEACDDAGDVVSRDADVFELPVVETMERRCRLAAMPTLHCAGDEIRYCRAKTRATGRCWMGS